MGLGRVRRGGESGAARDRRRRDRALGRRHGRAQGAGPIWRPGPRRYASTPSGSGGPVAVCAADRAAVRIAGPYRREVAPDHDGIAKILSLAARVEAQRRRNCSIPANDNDPKGPPPPRRPISTSRNQDERTKHAALRFRGSERRRDDRGHEIDRTPGFEGCVVARDRNWPRRSTNREAESA